MKLKVSELNSRALNWAVAKATRNEMPSVAQWIIWDDFRPTVDWQLCGRFIAEYQIYLDPPHSFFATRIGNDGERINASGTEPMWTAKISRAVAAKPAAYAFMPPTCYTGKGETPQIAICRAVVERHLGEVVDIPDQLLV